MAAGRPIACFAGGAKGVRHMHDAYVVPDHDYRELGGGILALLRDQELAARLGAAAKETVANFDWRRLCRAVEAVYQEVAGPRPEPSNEIAAKPPSEETALACDGAAVSGEPLAFAAPPDPSDLGLKAAYGQRNVGG
jgi:hypothetical protein